MRKYSRIIGTGGYLPEKVMTNHDISEKVDTTDVWIYERTGIRTRRIAADHETSSSMAEIAAREALDAANLDADDIDLIITATSTPDRIFPSTACLLQQRLGVRNCAAFDVQAACSGFIYGLSIAEQYIKTGVFKNILLIGAEVQSTAMDLTNKGRDTAVIFGDGAGAAIISATDEDRGILSTHMHSEGKHLKELWVESPASNRGYPRITEEHLQRPSWRLMNSDVLLLNHYGLVPKSIGNG